MKNLRYVLGITVFVISSQMFGSSEPPGVEWDATFGGRADEYAHCMIQTRDGGYAAAGWSPRKNGEDWFATSCYVVKTNSYGNEVWSRYLFGQDSHDYCEAIQQTADRGFVLLFQMNSTQLGGQIYLVKLDRDGQDVWRRSVLSDNPDNNSVKALKQTADKGFVIAGSVLSSGDFGNGSWDIYLVKVDENGKRQWAQVYGGLKTDNAYDVIQTSDGGYVLTGRTISDELPGYHDAWDAFILKTDKNGVMQKFQLLGGDSTDYCYSVKQTTDGGFIMAGLTRSFGNGENDMYLVKTDRNGNTQWTRTFGGSNNDLAYSLATTDDGGYILAGNTSSFNGCEGQAYVVKTDKKGNESWSRVFLSSSARSVEQTHDDGYILGGTTTMTTPLNSVDFYMVKLAPESTAELDEVLVSYLDCNNNLFDSATGGNHGQYWPGRSVYSEGFDGTANGAISLDGNHRVSLTQQTFLPMFNEDAFTLAMWVKGGAQSDKRIFSESNTTGNNNPLFTLGTESNGVSRTLRLFIRDNNGTVIASRSSQREPFDNSWHHVAFVDNNGSAILYIDGVRDAADFSYQKQSLSLTETTLGGVLRQSVCCMFSGSIDDVQLFSQALSAEEVRTVMGVPSDCPEKGDTILTGLIAGGGGFNNLPGWYDATVTSASDSSGDPILYTFTMDNPLGIHLQSGPGLSNTGRFLLTPGRWVFRASVDDDLFCNDFNCDSMKRWEFHVDGSPTLISQWNFDGDLVDRGDADVGNDGVASGGGNATYVEGFDGTSVGAVSLNGLNQYISLTQNGGLPIFSTAEAFTIAMFVKGSPQNDRRIFAETNRSGNNATLFSLGTDQNGQTGKLDFYLRNDDNQTIVNHFQSDREPFDNTWHHIAWVDNDGEVALYIDGIRDAADFTYTRSKLTSDETTLGAVVRGSAGNFFKGAIDDVRIYNYALTDVDVESLVPEPPGCPLVGDTHCRNVTISGPNDDGEGTYTVTASAIDDSGDTPLYYTYVAYLPGANPQRFQVGPTTARNTSFDLTEGTWIVTVTVDDDLSCRDMANDAENTSTVLVLGEQTFTPFVRGDTNGDNQVNIADAICVLSYLFGGDDAPCKDKVPGCLDAADINDDGQINIADAIKVLGHLFAGSGDLPAPAGSCGIDPTQDILNCIEYSACAKH